jgi:hypothetical protein
VDGSLVLWGQGGCAGLTLLVRCVLQVGDQLRVDGSLMGVDSKSQTLIPEWKRGHFSLLLDGSVPSPRLWVAFHAMPRHSMAIAMPLLQPPHRPAYAAGRLACPRQGAQTHAASSHPHPSPGPCRMYVNRLKQSYIDVGAGGAVITHHQCMHAV